MHKCQGFSRAEDGWAHVRIDKTASARMSCEVGPGLATSDSPRAPGAILSEITAATAHGPTYS